MLSFAASDALSNAAVIAAEIARTGGTFVVSPSENNAENTRTACSSSNAMAEEPSAAAPWLSQQGRVSPSSHEEDDSSSDSDDDEERRVAKSRERNREHARKTRLRKKAQLEALQSRVKGLRAEAEVLNQSLEECSLASILICLSQNKKQDQITDSLLNVAENSKAETCTKEADEIVQLVGGKRKRFASPDAEDGKAVSSQPLKLRVNGKISYIGGGGRSHINWKTGVYSDDHGVQKQLTQNQLESLRYAINTVLSQDTDSSYVLTILFLLLQTRTQSNARQDDSRSKEEFHCDN